MPVLTFKTMPTPKRGSHEGHCYLCSKKHTHKQAQFPSWIEILKGDTKEGVDESRTKQYQSPELSRLSEDLLKYSESSHFCFIQAMDIDAILKQ